MIKTKAPEKYMTYFSTKSRDQIDQPNIVPPLQENKRIAIPSQNEVVFVKLKDILGFEANGNYTKIHLLSGKHYLVCQTLRKFEERLRPYLFMRFNRKWLVNILLISRYIRRDKCVVMNNGLNISLSDKHRDSFFSNLKNPVFLW